MVYLVAWLIICLHTLVCVFMWEWEKQGLNGIYLRITLLHCHVIEHLLFEPKDRAIELTTNFKNELLSCSVHWLLITYSDTFSLLMLTIPEMFYIEIMCIILLSYKHSCIFIMVLLFIFNAYYYFLLKVNNFSFLN